MVAALFSLIQNGRKHWMLFDGHPLFVMFYQTHLLIFFFSLLHIPPGMDTIAKEFFSILLRPCHGCPPQGFFPRGS